MASRPQTVSEAAGPLTARGLRPATLIATILLALLGLGVIACLTSAGACAATTRHSVVAAETGGDALTTAAPKALTAGERVPNQLGPIRSFVTKEDMTYYRVYSGERNVGGFLTGVPPGSADEAVAGLALPPENTADFLQEVLVPAGTRLQSSIAAPAFEQPGGLLQFELLEDIPIKNFGPGMAFR